MDQNKTILLTGAAGFIGSYMTGYLNAQGYEDLILVDEFNDEEKELNLHTKKYRVRVEREDLFEWLEKEKPVIDFVLHLGARTDTAEFNYPVLEKLNVEYSKNVWQYCAAKNLPAGRQGIPLIYASSAATYGSGELGYKDDHALAEKLNPLNPYGISKNEFDKWMLKQSPDSRLSATDFPFWAGLKFFNVYGPNEYHKGRMASMVFHGFNQIQSTGKVKLFKSHKPEYKDGEQLRDFIYVADVCKVMFWMMNRVWSADDECRQTGRKRRYSESGVPTMNVGKPVVSAGIRSRELRVESLEPGLYNLGTGKARTFIDLVTPIFTSLGVPVNIEFIDIPEDIRDKYQYFTEADMSKLRHAGYTDAFYTVEEGVSEYVKNYLLPKKFY